MKNGKLLILLVAILSFTLVFVACSDSSASDTTSTVGPDADTAATEGETDAVTGAESQDEEPDEVIDQKIRDYLVLDTESADPLGTVVRIDASVVSFDDESGLAVLKTQDLDSYNNVIDTYKVYNVYTDEVILEKSVSNLYQGEQEDRKSLEITVMYPTILVSEGYYSVDNSEMRYNVSLYCARQGSEAIYSATGITYEKANDYSVREFYNGLVAATVNNQVKWIDRDMNVIRSVDAIAQNGYYGYFDAEYQGYLYAWDNNSVKVFNRSGLCSGQYVMEHEGKLGVFVLDNGNVLIQDAEIVDQYTSCNFTVDNVRYLVKSYVMDFVDGALTEVALDYVVQELETSYAQRYGDSQSAFPFALAQGRDNQAYVYRFATGLTAPVADYVVINNDLVIEYTVENDTVGVDFAADSGVINENYYYAAVESGGIMQNYIFDLSGNAVGVISGEIAGNYRVTDGKVYDLFMNVVVDAEAEGYTPIVSGDTVYLTKYNYVTGAEEFYVLNGEKPTLIADGVNTTAIGSGSNYSLFDGYYFLVENETNDVIVFTVEGEELLRSGQLYNFAEFDGGVIFVGGVNGRDVLYVVK